MVKACFKLKAFESLSYHEQKEENVKIHVENCAELSRLQVDEGRQNWMCDARLQTLVVENLLQRTHPFAEQKLSVVVVVSFQLFVANIRIDQEVVVDLTAVNS